MTRSIPGVLRNTAFRRLWLAQAVSLVGDWFTLIALSVVVSRASHGSGVAVAALLLTQLVPTALVGPFAGVLADRFDRRRLLVASDLLRSGIVLLLIPAVRGGALLPVYALALAHFTVATVFEPARSALVPRLVSGGELVAATTLTSVTWSVMTALGGMLGGGVLAMVGAPAAFAIDATTFVASALLIASLSPPPADPAGAGEAAGPGFREGLRYVAREPATGAVLLVKSMAGLGLVDTFLVIYATRVFPVGDGGAVSLGLLWACFGLGAVLGPALLNLVNDGSVRRMRRLIVAGAAMVVAGLFGLGHAPGLAVAGLAIVVRGMGGSANWTYSSVILQKVVPDGLRGRLFAIDLALLTLTAATGSVAWGYAIDRFGVRPVVQAVSGLCALAALAWSGALPWMERRDAASEQVRRATPARARG